eukprot:TRINITY_DN988_c0_g1_i1.p1 TRINITY_DN988_c0_g1~~TRINITY_DN988_c0_g1_i1.p1  ORF type:complete len:115 (-),score=23.55 TRINITY_DN988_c0_g1_i1:132-476(-)
MNNIRYFKNINNNNNVGRNIHKTSVTSNRLSTRPQNKQISVTSAFIAVGGMFALMVFPRIGGINEIRRKGDEPDYASQKVVSDVRWNPTYVNWTSSTLNTRPIFTKDGIKEIPK